MSLWGLETSVTTGTDSSSGDSGFLWSGWWWASMQDWLLWKPVFLRLRVLRHGERLADAVAVVCGGLLWKPVFLRSRVLRHGERLADAVAVVCGGACGWEWCGCFLDTVCWALGSHHRKRMNLPRNKRVHIIWGMLAWGRLHWRLDSLCRDSAVFIVDSWCWVRQGWCNTVVWRDETHDIPQMRTVCVFCLNHRSAAMLVR